MMYDDTSVKRVHAAEGPLKGHFHLINDKNTGVAHNINDGAFGFRSVSAPV